MANMLLLVLGTLALACIAAHFGLVLLVQWQRRNDFSLFRSPLSSYGFDTAGRKLFVACAIAFVNAGLACAIRSYLPFTRPLISGLVLFSLAGLGRLVSAAVLVHVGNLEPGAHAELAPGASKDAPASVEAGLATVGDEREQSRNVSPVAVSSRTTVWHDVAATLLYTGLSAGSTAWGRGLVGAPLPHWWPLKAHAKALYGIGFAVVGCNLVSIVGFALWKRGIVGCSVAGAADQAWYTTSGVWLACAAALVVQQGM